MYGFNQTRCHESKHSLRFLAHGVMPTAIMQNAAKLKHNYSSAMSVLSVEIPKFFSAFA